MMFSFSSRLMLFSALALTLAVQAATAQDLHPSRRPSPTGIAKTHIGDTYVKVTYGRPYVRDRDVFGANTDSTTFLVPFGELWRTGANEATEITVSGPVTLGGNHLDPGTYSVFAEPESDAWTLHISPLLGLDGTGRLNRATGEFTPDVYSPDSDLFTFTAPALSLPEDEPVDQFTIAFEESESGVEMVLTWELTEVRIPIAAD